MAYQVPASSVPHANFVSATNGIHEQEDFSTFAHYDGTEILTSGLEQYIDSATPIDFPTAVAVLNQARSIYNLHITYENGGTGIPCFAHKINDGRIVTVGPMDGSALYSTIFNSIKTLYLAVRTSYVNHIANKKPDQTAAVYHTAADTVDVLGAVPVINDEADLAVDMNNLKAQYNLHAVNITSVHGTADSMNGITAANAVQGDLLSFITLVNQMKTKLNAHFALGATVHPGAFGADTQNTIVAASVTLPSGLFDLINDIYTKYELHRVDTATHNIADSTNALAGIITYPVTTLPNLVSGAATIQTKLNAHFRFAPAYSRALRVV